MSVGRKISKRGWMCGFSWPTLGPRLWTFVIPATLAVIPLSPAAAADGPECGQIFPSPSKLKDAPASLPRAIQLRGDLSSLREFERRNIYYYVSDKTRHGEPIPETVWLFPLIWAPPEPLLSLILEDGPCEDRCKGVAVLPRQDGIRLQKFSYRKNYVSSFGDWNWIKGDRFYEMPSMQFSFMDESEGHVMSFFDVRRSRQPIPLGSPDMRFVEVDRSEGMIDNKAPRQFDYAACFNNSLGENAEIPAILGSALDSGDPKPR